MSMTAYRRLENQEMTWVRLLVADLTVSSSAMNCALKWPSRDAEMLFSWWCSMWGTTGWFQAAAGFFQLSHHAKHLVKRIKGHSQMILFYILRCWPLFPSPDMRKKCVGWFWVFFSTSNPSYGMILCTWQSLLCYLISCRWEFTIGWNYFNHSSAEEFSKVSWGYFNVKLSYLAKL